jgi:hypothetical protein
MLCGVALCVAVAALQRVCAAVLVLGMPGNGCNTYWRADDDDLGQHCFGLFVAGGTYIML